MREKMKGKKGEEEDNNTRGQEEEGEQQPC